MKYCDSCRTPYPADYTTCPKDQTALRLSSELVAGTILRGKYEILGPIGAGGMGAVYKARHVVFGELRAIKFLGTHLAEQDGYLERFRTEAVVARKLQHPNAVRIDDFDTAEDGRPFIVMEYVEGQSLRHLLRKDGALPFVRAADVTRQACAALGAAHALGIVHRDIKPDNMLLVAQPDGSDLVKILDFGLAKIREGFEGSSGQVATRTGMVMGTPEYMSPEQAIGSKADELDGRTDLYALGIVLYEMVTGRVPFSSETPIKTILQHVQDDPVPARRLRPDLPATLAGVLVKTLAKERASRFPSAEAMRVALSDTALLQGSPTAPRALDSGAVPTRITPQRPSADSQAATGPAPALTKGRPAAIRAAPPAAGSGAPVLLWAVGALVLASAAIVMMRRPGSAPGAPASPGPEPATLAPVDSQSAAPAPGAPADGSIQSEIERLFFGSAPVRDARISVQVLNGIVTLSGEAPDATVAELASTLAKSVGGVQRVFSTVRVPTAPLATAESAAPPPASTPVPAEASRPSPPPPPAADDQVEQLLRQARRALDERNPRAAEDAFEAVLVLDPNNPRAQEALKRLREHAPPPR